MISNPNPEMLQRCFTCSCKPINFIYKKQQYHLRPCLILYIEAKDHSIIIYGLNDSAGIKYNIDLGTFEKYLDADIFKRCHHSHIINTRYVLKHDSKRGEYVTLLGNKTINIGTTHKNAVLAMLNKTVN